MKTLVPRPLLARLPLAGGSVLAVGEVLALGLVLALGSALVAGQALAAGQAPARTVFSCQDDSGRTVFSDRMPAACAQRTVRELRSDGLVRREIAPPLSAEQQRLRQSEERERALAARERTRSAARDRALLDAYPDMDALRVTQQRHLADIDDEIAASQRRVAELRATHAEVRGQATAPDGRVLPASNRRLADLSATIQAEEKHGAQRRAERERVQRRFDEDAERLQALLRPGTGAGALSRAGGAAAR